ncbi:tRNA-uridine aminocarboxypropyltransferase [Halobacteriovorax sp.]|uniref:tRNA-uridine aminocarboxypropyltransferase n=1 Tax=Halobacteriovorax sp. TaxID=2020862 RepID=UPI003564299D
MTSRFSNIDKRCENCRIFAPLCFCKLLVKKEHRTPVRIVMHKSELGLTTNTAFFCEKVLKDSSIHLRGVKGTLLDVESTIDLEKYTPLYLFPDDSAVELNSELLSSLNKPPLLVVPDGSWSQAKKFKKRESSLANIKSVKLPPGIKSNYRLRTSPAEGAVCTYEAIAIALGICEGNELKDSLLDIFKVITDRMYYSRSGIVSLEQLDEILKKEADLN